MPAAPAVCIPVIVQSRIRRTNPTTSLLKVCKVGCVKHGALAYPDLGPLAVGLGRRQAGLGGSAASRLLPITDADADELNGARRAWPPNWMDVGAASRSIARLCAS